MAPNFRFWRNLTLIGLAHAALITGLVRWSHTAEKPAATNVVWLNDGGGGDGAAEEPKTPPKTKSIAPVPERTPELLKRDEVEEDRPVLTSMESEIQLPKPTPRSTATPAATASPARTPKPTPKPKPS